MSHQTFKHWGTLFAVIRLSASTAGAQPWHYWYRCAAALVGMILSLPMQLRKKRPDLLPAAAEQYTQQQYLRMRWHGPMNFLLPMDVTFCEIAMVDSNVVGRGRKKIINLFTCLNRKQRRLRQASPRRISNYRKCAHRCRLIFLDQKPTPYQLDLTISKQSISGTWQYNFGTTGESIALPANH